MDNTNKLLFQGHGCVRLITAEGKVIYLDPFAGGGYDKPADLILITHSHFDHTQTQKIAVKNPGCRLITNAEALQNGKHQSFDLGYVKVEAVEAGYNKNHSASECVGYILTFSNGTTVYFSGDTSTTPQMKELAARDLDFAFFCCDGVYNMDIHEAVKCADMVGAKHSIPYHSIATSGEVAFSRERAETFNAKNKCIIEPGEEIEMK
ncbi:MAG: MBL fold metallo-hydrolase [Firmicutes bacterium]|nr:MBL fold metallo-hydrolase [Bacillota bacterium]